MEALEGVGFTHYAVSNHYFLRAIVQVGYVKNPVSLSKNIFSASSFFMHIFNMSVTNLKVLKRCNESSKRSWFHKVRTIIYYFLGAVVRKWLKNPVIVKKYFFSIKLLYAHLQYVCNIPAKCWKDLMKALVGGVDFAKYALSVIIQTTYCKNYKVA